MYKARIYIGIHVRLNVMNDVAIHCIYESTVRIYDCIYRMQPTIS